MCVKLAAAGGSSLGRVTYTDTADKAVAGTIRWKSYHFSRTTGSQYIFSIQKATPTGAFQFALVKNPGAVANGVYLYANGNAGVTPFTSASGVMSPNRWNTCGFSWQATTTSGSSSTYPELVINGNVIPNAGASSATLTDMGGDITIGGRAPVGGASEGDRSSDALFKYVEYYKGIVIPTADMIAEDNGTLTDAAFVTDDNPSGYCTLREKYAAWLYDTWDFVTSTTSTNGVTASTGGTVAMQARTPGDVWGVCGLYDPRSASNTETSGRCTVAKDLSGCENDAVESAGTGPLVVDDGSGIGVKHWAAVNGLGVRNLQMAGVNLGPDVRSYQWCAIAVLAFTVDIFGASQSPLYLGELTGLTGNFGFYAGADYLLTQRSIGDIQAHTMRVASNPRALIVGSGSWNSTPVHNAHFFRQAGVTVTGTTTFGSWNTSGLGRMFNVGGAGSPFYGDMYLMAILQRPPQTLRFDELAAIDAWETANFTAISPATWNLEADGSSSMEGSGWGQTLNRTIVHRISNACRVPRAVVRNWGTGTVRYPSFVSGLSSEINSSSNNPQSLDKDHRMALVAYGFGDLTGNWPNPDGIANLATLKSNYVTNVFTPLATTFGCLVCLPIFPVATVGNNHTQRQADAEDWNSWLVNTLPGLLTGTRVIVPRIDQLSVLDYTGYAGADVGAKVQAMIADLTGTAAGEYYADVTHLNDNYWALAEPLIETAVCTYMTDTDDPATITSSSRNRLIERMLLKQL